ncbi:MAG: type II secretion system F family protein [Candidatus Nanohaloarchaea archaeon]|nr:type II secretion system F family protein [Candidatus Nanohaloarchaea archaeon]
MVMKRLVEIVYSLIPEFYRGWLEEEARHAKISNQKEIVFYIYALFLVLGAVFVPLFSTSLTVASVLSTGYLLLVFFIPYLVFTLLANKRKKEIERVLPDALQLVSANIESGLTVEKAFLLAARDEFGPLAEDLRHVAVEIFGGTSVRDALSELAESTNSELFAETLNLLQDSIEAGGDISKLLESSASDVQKSLQLREEIKTNVRMYSLFITIASVLGAPLLFAISVFLTKRTNSMWTSQSVNFENLPSTGPLRFSKPSISPEFFADFALVAIIVSNIFAALIISEIKNGNVKEGVKYMPFFVGAGVALFLIAQAIVTSTFGSFV